MGLINSQRVSEITTGVFFGGDFGDVGLGVGGGGSESYEIHSMYELTFRHCMNEHTQIYLLKKLQK